MSNANLPPTIQNLPAGQQINVIVQAPVNKPSYWGGLILNCVWLGAGFLLLGHIGLFLLWWLGGGAVIGFAWLFTIAGASTGSTEATGAGLLITLFIGFAVWVGSLIHYRNVYAAKFGA